MSFGFSGTVRCVRGVPGMREGGPKVPSPTGGRLPAASGSHPTLPASPRDPQPRIFSPLPLAPHSSAHAQSEAFTLSSHKWRLRWWPHAGSQRQRWRAALDVLWPDEAEWFAQRWFDDLAAPSASNNRTVQARPSAPRAPHSSYPVYTPSALHVQGGGGSSSGVGGFGGGGSLGLGAYTTSPRALPQALPAVPPLSSLGSPSLAPASPPHAALAHPSVLPRHSAPPSTILAEAHVPAHAHGMSHAAGDTHHPGPLARPSDRPRGCTTHLAVGPGLGARGKEEISP